MAYDRVPRGKLFSVLKSVGCGVVMLCALMSMYSTTTSILGSVIYYRHNLGSPRFANLYFCLSCTSKLTVSIILKSSLSHTGSIKIRYGVVNGKELTESDFI